MNAWTDPDLDPDEAETLLDALRQILEGEYRPWCRDRPNVAAATEAKPNTKATKPTPLFDREAA